MRIVAGDRPRLAERRGAECAVVKVERVSAIENRPVVVQPAAEELERERPLADGEGDQRGEPNGAGAETDFGGDHPTRILAG